MRIAWASIPAGVAIGVASVLHGTPGTIARVEASPPPSTLPHGTRWKPNTHIFAANLAMQDALDDGKVTIPPYGEIPANPDAVRALRRFPNDYRGGVLGPDVFPDIYVGQSLAHADKSADHDRWTSDHWLRHVLREARTLGQRTNSDDERDRALAFAYGFVTHAAGDMFGHSYVNDWGDGRRGEALRVWDWSDPIVVARHVVLESYVGAHVPATDLTIDVWPRFVANTLIRHDRVLASTAGDAPHYRHWVRLHARVSDALEDAKRGMRAGLPDGAPYAAQCLAHPDACAAKEFLETWQRNLEEGMRELVVANLALGRGILTHRVTDGISAFTSWNAEWTPKMHGAHAPAEAMKWIAANNPLTPLTDAVRDSIVRFLLDQYRREFAYLRMMASPAMYMDSVYRPSIRAMIDADMHLGSDARLDWREFEPLYNTVILSKLALLDGAGLNELARRAGVAAPPYPDGDSVNVLFGVVRTMDGHHQWNPDSAYGYRYQPYRPPGSTTTAKGARLAPTAEQLARARAFTGFAFYADPEAREKVFARIFKGYGPGPGGMSSLTEAIADGARSARDSARTPPSARPAGRIHQRPPRKP